MISSSNFVAIAWLVILARKDPRTASPFSSLLKSITLIDLHFVLTASFSKEGEYKEGKFHRQRPNTFQAKSLTLTEYLPSKFVTVIVSNIVRF